MLGKFTTILSFVQSLKIYLIRRYPSNKLPLTGIIFSSYLLSFIAYRACLNGRIRKLRSERLGSCGNASGCKYSLI